MVVIFLFKKRKRLGNHDFCALLKQKTNIYYKNQQKY